MTLKDFLYCIKDTYECHNYLDTNNESFPDFLRHNYIHYAELYIKIEKSDNSLFDKIIKNISLKNDIDCTDDGKGFITSIIRYKIEVILE